MPVFVPADSEEIVAELRNGDAEAISLRVEDSTADEALFLLIEVAKTCPVGMVTWEIDIGTRSDAARVTLTLLGNVLGAVYASPSHLIFERREEAAKVAIIHLLNRSDDSQVQPQAINVPDNLSQWLHASVEGDALRVEFSPMTQNTKKPLTFAKRIRGSISVKTDITSETIMIPVEIW